MAFHLSNKITFFPRVSGRICSLSQTNLFSASSSCKNNRVQVDVIAHRGAPGYMPDHTLPTYQSAFESGSDWIEVRQHGMKCMDSCQTDHLFFFLSQKLDAHCTKDGVLVVNHDVELSEMMDVADWDWAKPLRTRTKVPTVDGEPASLVGWVISDFTLDQIK
jgi:glycerophosphoryl diester phosphodiesterase